MTSWVAHRSPINPLITPESHPLAGENIQGPSLIRVPDWVRDPLGRYYLYFADHKGDRIRLAYADALEGPWRLHGPGALSLADSLFPTERITPPADAPAFVPRPDWAPEGTPGIPSRADDAVVPHIASPDVIVDHPRRQIRLYYHGLSGYNRQQTRVALSEDGRHFTPREPLLGPAYFRVFAHGGWHYALTMPGVLLRSRDGLDGFERGPDLFGEPRQRHTAVLLEGDTLWVFWSRVGDAPERLYVSTVDLQGDWSGWRAQTPQELMRPEHDWEGAHLPPSPSWRSAIAMPANQLRDPAIHVEGGRIWLLYAVQGERGIAIAELSKPARA